MCGTPMIAALEMIWQTKTSKQLLIFVFERPIVLKCAEAIRDKMISDVDKQSKPIDKLETLIDGLESLKKERSGSKFYQFGGEHNLDIPKHKILSWDLN